MFLIILLIIGFLCVGLVWFARKRRRDLFTRQANQTQVGDERTTGTVFQEQAEPSEIVRKEQAPVPEMYPTALHADDGEKAESADVREVISGPQEAHETNPSGVQSQSPLELLSTTPVEEPLIQTGTGEPASLEHPPTIIDEPALFRPVLPQVEPCEDPAISSPATEKRADAVISVEHEDPNEGLRPVAEAPEELAKNSGQRRGRRTNAEDRFTKTGVEEQEQRSKPEPEGAIAILESQPATPPSYSGLAPVPHTVRPQPARRDNDQQTSSTGTSLNVRVQLTFDRHGGLRTLALVPDRRDGMPEELDIYGSQGELRLIEFRDDCYEPVPITNVGKTLSEGVEWRGRDDARRWRWVLSGRQLYVFARGDECGLHGFVSTSRLCLNAPHVILMSRDLRDEVLAALAKAGCGNPEVSDDTMPGVPPDWLLVHDVKPTNTVPMREEAHILNALCPLPDVEPHFIGGIRLQARMWLVGYPPCIRFTGALGNVKVMIDGQPAHIAADGAFDAPGWDNEGEHRLWFGGQSITYSLRVMDEVWDRWHAHDLNAGASICGAGINRRGAAPRFHVRVPAANPLIIGAVPGEVFHCRQRKDIRCNTFLSWVPFEPVWALPFDSAHVDKRSARILLIHPMEPIAAVATFKGNRAATLTHAKWIAVINDASRKQLSLAAENEDSKALWCRYRAVAKHLWRKMR